MKFRNQQQKKHTEAFVAHFQLLGLRRGECRSNVIRSAAYAMAVALNNQGSNFVGDKSGAGQCPVDHFRQSTDDVDRARIAIAAYRLLDPRERTDTYERVQLCYPIDRDDSESHSVSTGKLIDQMPKVPSKTCRQSSAVKQFGQSMSSKACEGILPLDDEPVAEDSFTQVSGNLSMDERRSIVQLMRKSNESTLRGLSPLGWLKSQLGI